MVSSLKPVDSQPSAPARALILAAGLGQRLRPLTDYTPKCLMPILGRPLLDYWLSHLADAGIREIAINSHAHPDQMDVYLGAVQRRAGVDVLTSFEPTLLGSAGTLAALKDFLAHPASSVVIYGDNLSDIDLRAMLNFHREHEQPITMAVNRPEDLHTCGVAVLDEQGTVTDFEEKPSRPRSEWANAGVYVFDQQVFQTFDPETGTDIGRDLLPRFVGRMMGWSWGGESLDIGTEDRYAAALRRAPDILAPRGFDGLGRRPAVFLDRDGTLIEPVHYLRDPRQVRLMPDAAAGIRKFRAAGFSPVVVTNQSAVGRGLMTEAELRAVNKRLCELLAKDGAVLDAIYYSTAVPRSLDRTVVEFPDRKPGCGMLHRAATDLRLNLESSWIVGDMISDALAGYHAGLAGCALVRPRSASPQSASDTARFPCFDGLRDAVGFILQQSGRRHDTN